MTEGVASFRDLFRSRLFWLCLVAVVQGVLFLLFPRLPASLEVLAGAVLVVLLAGVIHEKEQPGSRY